MGSVRTLADEIRKGMEGMMPWLRKTVLKKLPLVVAALIEARTPNTAVLAAMLPLDLAREDMRQQWLRRLLSTGELRSDRELEPFARESLQMASSSGQTVLLSMDQTDLSIQIARLWMGEDPPRTGGSPGQDAADHGPGFALVCPHWPSGSTGVPDPSGKESPGADLGRALECKENAP
ncbi:MAG: hypothetical protein AW09_003797 [Candidatus Accumulibacter phosphatis]|uniref:Uncharacterized protein n=1 Tax=Candidatus Accumulibacter phosphatis TaxID=327160 RepID=A0A080M1S1_9PROT|nr:hypothetical protein [Accumulibacter sp.]KFB71084.1 MAG: hypothetical protein AW09_003797 [Candidatus Accumulibacter phosphatis]MBL8407101.1 hypothetical protein [Accumulibacter sp.]HRF13135.1 hypothetical protein [Candidatus Accumulibacter phosphatis]